ncbi:hypothetical protein ABH920_001412 [Catenulispora sp. EB89]|uniref:general stress protein n=1 Tax=Catenulispora sp. EB89 TaxID=3156257 RepID=UPI003510FB0D
MMNTATSASMRVTIAAASGNQVSLGSYPTYAQAQGVIERLADQQFEVETTEIIGTELRMVEQVTGRLTWPRALVGGIATGAWFGLFAGLLIDILTSVSLGRALLLGLTWGVVFGGVYTAVGYGLIAGRRDFTSRSAIVPNRFEVLVAAAHSDRAHALLAASPR